MKPEVVKFLFDCYLKKKQGSSFHYDDVDGISWTKRPVAQGSLAGETGFENHDRCTELLYLMPESSSPVEPHHVPLDPQQEELARNFGRQLSNMSDEFELEHTSERSSGNDAMQFEKRCLFVSPSSDKVEIPVVRVGNTRKEVTVSWKTKDKTAQAGVHYIGSKGNILFREGEVKKIIEIKLLGNNEDTSFIVELLDSDSLEIGSVNPLTVNITDHEHLYTDEKNVIENILESRHPLLINVIDSLQDKVTVNTFKTALMYMCSNADSLPQEFVFAFELVRAALPSTRRETLMQVVSDYFQRAPELEELDIKEGDESSEEEKEDSDEESD